MIAVLVQLTSCATSPSDRPVAETSLRLGPSVQPACRKVGSAWDGEPFVGLGDFDPRVALGPAVQLPMSFDGLLRQYLESQLAMPGAEISNFLVTVDYGKVLVFRDLDRWKQLDSVLSMSAQLRYNGYAAWPLGGQLSTRGAIRTRVSDLLVRASRGDARAGNELSEYVRPQLAAHFGLRLAALMWSCAVQNYANAEWRRAEAGDPGARMMLDVLHAQDPRGQLPFEPYWRRDERAYEAAFASRRLSDDLGNETIFGSSAVAARAYLSRQQDANSLAAARVALSLPNLGDLPRRVVSVGLVPTLQSDPQIQLHLYELVLAAHDFSIAVAASPQLYRSFLYAQKERRQLIEAIGKAAAGDKAAQEAIRLARGTDGTGPGMDQLLSLERAFTGLTNYLLERGRGTENAYQLGLRMISFNELRDMSLYHQRLGMQQNTCRWAQEDLALCSSARGCDACELEERRVRAVCLRPVTACTR